jgi:hypothetical protein
VRRQTTTNIFYLSNVKPDYRHIKFLLKILRTLFRSSLETKHTPAVVLTVSQKRVAFATITTAVLLPVFGTNRKRAETQR